MTNLTLNIKEDTEQVIAQNETSLKAILRSIAFAQNVTESIDKFSLIIIQCNYPHLRQHIIQSVSQGEPFFPSHLIEFSTIPTIAEIRLPKSVKTLYTYIKDQVDHLAETPAAVMVSGLETVSAIDEVLTSANLVREAFRYNFPFPVCLWVNDQIMTKLIRLVPDIESWATSYNFTLTVDELLKFIQENTAKVFQGVLDIWDGQLPGNTNILGELSALELDLAYQDLVQRGIELKNPVKASCLFVIGRYYNTNQDLEKALENYQQSWQLLQQEKQHPTDAQTSYNCLLEWESVVLFHLGWCYRRKAESSPIQSRENWLLAKQHFAQCIADLEAVNKSRFIKKFIITQLGETLRSLQDWTALKELAMKARQWHQESGETAQLQLAQDYGFLAEVSLQEQDWESAKEWALVALDLVANAPLKTEIQHDSAIQDASIKAQHQALYLLILAKAQAHLEQQLLAIKNLENARSQAQPLYDPSLYLAILEELQKLYFQHKKYRQAFDMKQEFRVISHQFGYTAFIGAGRLQPKFKTVNLAAETTNPILKEATKTYQFLADEIEASGRQTDVEELIKRVASTQHKLTVIYGESGVGKSSLLTAGLMPALVQRETIGTRQVAAVIMQVYQDWAKELEKKLLGITLPTENESEEDTFNRTERIESILDKLQKNQEKNYLTVIIFDQFEELFIVGRSPHKRASFFEFLRKILNIPFVKIIISLREDYLHLLLDGSRLKLSENKQNNDILNDVLNKDNLFELGNFSLEVAERVITVLNKRSVFRLEKNLIDRIVKDLAENTSEIRPIELQIVGAELQTENINTLAKYRQLGHNPKQKLVQGFLEQVLHDCGVENEKIGLGILYLLTDENQNRPLKTRAELGTALALEEMIVLSGQTLPVVAVLEATSMLQSATMLQIRDESVAIEKSEQLDLILYILEKSGLVFLWKEVPVELYQLVHDYLVTFIRQKYEQLHELESQAKYKAKEEEIRQLKIQQEQAQKNIKMLEQLNQSQAKEKETQAQLNSALSRLNGALAVILMGLIPITFLGWLVFQQRAAESNALNLGLTALLSSTNKNDQLGKLIATVEIGKRYLNKSIKDTENRNIVDELRQVIATVQEYNRFIGHEKSVQSVAFSPDGKILASASPDGKVKIWDSNGNFYQDLILNEGAISVTFSPQGNILVATGYNQGQGVIKLWQKKGKQFQEWQSIVKHEGLVNNVSFSPDGRLFASLGSVDKMVKIWDIQGNLVKSFLVTNDEEHPIYGNVVFSPDGEKLATATEKAVKIWQLDGKLLKTIAWVPNPQEQSEAEQQGFNKVIFSSDGKQIVTANADRTVKIWQLDGSLLKTLKGHSNQVIDINFHPTGNAIASASEDGTVIIWSPQGELLNTFRGHQGIVREVKFSPDGQRLASVGDDKTVKLWRSYTPITKILFGHSDWVYSVYFSADRTTLASASADGTIALWTTDGQLIKIWKGHQDAVTGVSFSIDSKILASSSWDDTVKLWDRKGNLMKTLVGHQDDIYSVSFSPNGQILASGGADRKVIIWGVDGSRIKTLINEDLVLQVKFSENGKIIGATSGNQVNLWSIDGKLLYKLRHQEAVQSLSFSSDQKIAIASGKTVQLWDLNGRKLDIKPLEHEDKVEAVVFSRNGDRLASVAGRTVTLWTVAGEKLATLVNAETVKNVSFSRDDRTLALATIDKTVILWSIDDDLGLEGLLSRSCIWLKDYLEHNAQVQKSHHQLCQQ